MKFDSKLFYLPIFFLLMACPGGNQPNAPAPDADPDQDQGAGTPTPTDEQEQAAQGVGGPAGTGGGGGGAGGPTGGAGVGGPAGDGAGAGPRAVMFNGRTLPDEEVRAFWQASSGTPDFPQELRRNWWYDNTSGLYGEVGLPLTWRSVAGLDANPNFSEATRTALRTLDPRASLAQGQNGLNYTINGRIVPPVEDAFWRWLSFGLDPQTGQVSTTPVNAGAYRIDAAGNIFSNNGFQDNLVSLFNLRAYGNRNGPTQGRSRVIDTGWLVGTTITGDASCSVITFQGVGGPITDGAGPGC